ncbi:MAG: oxidoreductase [Bacteroidales bacterium]|nr:oxidoreductase [Bacteroidales bacterium]
MEIKKIALITGASSGIGKETAIKLIEKGYVVYGAARRVDKMKDLEEKGVHVLSLDVTEEKSMQNCVDTIIEREKRIDILVNNAGYGFYGAVEDVPIDEARRQFEVNIFGLARLTQLVLPYMREQHYGKIINVSSMGGKMYTPFGSWYHATKHALEGFSDCLRLEVKPFGVDVIIVEPGGIKTEWGPIAAENLKKTSGKGAYSRTAVKAAEKTAELYRGSQLTDPKVIANTIYRAVSVNKPKRRYVKGYMAKPAIFMRKWFGDAFFDFVITRMA